MEVTSIVTGLIAIGYVIHDGEMALDRASAILSREASPSWAI